MYRDALWTVFWIVWLSVFLLIGTVALIRQNWEFLLHSIVIILLVIDRIDSHESRVRDRNGYR